MRLFHYCIVIVLFAASCTANTLPPASGATETITLVVSPVVAAATPTPLPAATSASGSVCTEIGQTWISPVDGVTLVCVPAGEFIMGATADDPQAKDNEKPQHRVYLDAFWMDRTEVTNANFAKCMADGACRPQVYEVSAKTYTPYPLHPDYQDYPALLHESAVAAAYCQWAGRRLPTEAEWEKAARGPGTNVYPWGEGLDCSKANYYACDNPPATPDLTAPRCGYSGRCRTTRVDDFPVGASPYGALNMAGNVWEWVADWYSPDYYANSPSRNPTGPAEGDYQVLRGGGSKSLPQELRVMTRSSGKPHHYFDGQVGFRCAASVVTP